MLAHTKNLPDIRLRGGEESLVVFHRRRGANVVVKMTSGADVEAAALRLADKQGVPVPRVHERRGSTLYLEWIPGKEPQESDANPRYLRRLASAVRALHGIRAPGIGNILAPKPYGDAAWKGYLKRRFDRSLRALERKRRISARDRARLEDAFSELAAAGLRSFEPTLVHGDLHLWNTRVTTGDQVVLLDFDDAFFGDPLFDLAPFRYFCPRLSARFRDAYAKRPFPGEKGALRWYSLVHAVEAAAFYADLGSAAHVRHALRVARSAAYTFS